MKRLLICDLDNTLYDWVGYFVEAFYSMVDEVVHITNCDREELLDDFRDVHRYHQDAEHPFALLETRTVQSRFPNKTRSELLQILDPAVYAFNSARKRHLRLYDDVQRTLDELRERRIPLVAHTESKLYAVVDRLSRLKLTDYFTRIYCRERTLSLHPSGASSFGYLSRFPMHKVIELSHHQRKPNEEVLLEICSREKVNPRDAAYVGDSMVRDMMMAKRAGVTAMWAEYGTRHQANTYDRLVRVSHWTPEDVAREKALAQEARQIAPDYILTHSFSEVLQALVREQGELAH